MTRPRLFDPRKPYVITLDGPRNTAVHRTKLNLRQKRFILEYLKDGNGTQAAIRAGYATSSAAVQAHRILNNEAVAEKIRADQARVQQSNDTLTQKTLSGLEAIAFADAGLLFDSKWNLLPPSRVPKRARDALRGIEVKASLKGGVRTVNVKFADRLAALELLGKRLGLFSKPLKAGR